MPFEPITKIVSPVVCLPVDNIDTDRIIPARFLKAVDSAGFGKNLFFDWRYLPDGTPDPEFVLNRPDGRGQILLTGRNFGCGSSREHAAWALWQHGFRVIISSGFADIFRTNALNNGLLPLEVDPETLASLMETYTTNPAEPWSVDLSTQLLYTSGKLSVPGISFEINAFRKQCLLTGSDLIDYLAGLKEQITAFEKQYQA
jgi:3-isopropylmalate/(R)-2-methylmalate dehydratase small subunit